VLLVSTPIVYGDRFLGMIGSVVDLQFLIRRLQEVNRAGLMPFVGQSRTAGGRSPGDSLPARHDEFRYRPQLCR
jgi:hypothetical protein